MSYSLEQIRTKVFIPDDKLIWIEAEVIEDHGDGIVTFQIDNNNDEDDDNSSFKNNDINDKIRKLNLRNYGLTLSSLPLQNIDTNDDSIGVDDMCDLSYLHEASILDNLRRRFKAKVPYTNTGDICIAVNPYQWLDIYTKEMKEEYYLHYRHELSPHIYATSSMAFRGLRERRKNQSILVSGESGAGKTESVKILMDHIASFAGKAGDISIDKVLKSNPLLESFGNAKTIRNDNSSRFGKFTQLQFDESCQLVGSKCVTYLLEKCRVVSQNPNERNYHIMYQLLSSPIEVRQSLYLGNCKYETFNYTNMGDTYTDSIEGFSDAERYIQTIDALKLLGVSPEVTKQLQEAIAGILFLGQLEFIGDNDSASVDDKTQVGVTICKLLNLDVSEFIVALTTRTIEVEGTKISIPLNMEQAIGGRDALAKEIYSRIFSWLVLIINYNTAFSPYNANMLQSMNLSQSLSPKQKVIYGVISLLDIFGFECFDINRFEQLCINFANEKLQQKFTMDVFKTVQQEYESEGLNWEMIKFEDNAHILDMIEGKGGILSLLNEECLLPKGKDSAYLSKLKISCSSHPAFSINLRSQNEFIVSHYAGKVSYNVTGFLDRNKDTLPDDMCQLLINSKNKLLSNLFSYELIFTGGEETEEFVTKYRSRAGELLLQIQSKPNDGIVHTPPNLSSFSNVRKGRPSLSGATVASDIMLEGFSTIEAKDSSSLSSSKKSFILAKTVTMKFKTSLHKLMEAIHLTEVQYVRCIKPNTFKCNRVFSRPMVVEQLRSAGMIEAIRISRAAYPYKMSQLDFIRRFAGIKSTKMNEKINAKTYCQNILSLLLSPSDIITPSPSDKKDTAKVYELGKTKVYFSAGVLEKLEAKRAQFMSDSVRNIQRMVRGIKQRKLYLLMRKSSILLQKLVRMRYTKKAFKLKIRSIIRIQSILRVLICKNYVTRHRRYNAASIIQSYRKMLVHYKTFQTLKSATIIIQSIGRMHIKRNRYFTIRDQARARSDLKNRLFIAEQELEKEALRREEAEQKLLMTTKRIETLEKDKNEGIYLSLIESLKAEIQRLNDENNELRKQNQEYLVKCADDNQLNMMLELEKERNSLIILKKQIDQEGMNLVLKAKKEIEDLKSKTDVETKLSNDKHIELLTTKEKFSSMICKNGIKVSVFMKGSNRTDTCIEKAGLIRMKNKRGLEDENTPNNELSFSYIECLISDTTETDDHAVRKKMSFDISSIDDIRKGWGKTLTIPETINTERCMNIIIENKGELNISFSNMMIRDASVMFFRDIITQTAMGKMNKLLSPKIIQTSEKSEGSWVRGRVRASDEVITIKRVSRK